jgi:hypothetical protein
MGGNTMDLIERTKAEELAKRFALNDGEEWNINIGRIVKIGARVEFDLAPIQFSHNSPHRLM